VIREDEYRIGEKSMCMIKPGSKSQAGGRLPASDFCLDQHISYRMSMNPYKMYIDMSMSMYMYIGIMSVYVYVYESISTSFCMFMFKNMYMFMFMCIGVGRELGDNMWSLEELQINFGNLLK